MIRARHRPRPRIWKKLDGAPRLAYDLDMQKPNRKARRLAMRQELIRKTGCPFLDYPGVTNDKLRKILAWVESRRINPAATPPPIALLDLEPLRPKLWDASKARVTMGRGPVLAFTLADMIKDL